MGYAHRTAPCFITSCFETVLEHVAKHQEQLLGCNLGAALRMGADLKIIRGRIRVLRRIGIHDDLFYVSLILPQFARFPPVKRMNLL